MEAVSEGKNAIQLHLAVVLSLVVVHLIHQTKCRTKSMSSIGFTWETPIGSILSKDDT